MATDDTLLSFLALLLLRSDGDTFLSFGSLVRAFSLELGELRVDSNLVNVLSVLLAANSFSCNCCSFGCIKTHIVQVS